MNWKILCASSCAFLMLYFFNIEGLEAQSRLANNNNFAPNPIGMKAAMMFLSVGLGFCIGWFLTPAASSTRMFVAIGGGLFLFIAALANDGFFGMGSALFISCLGFFIAFGYWVKKGVTALGQTPSTFGSSHWATSKDLDEYKLFDDGGIRVGRFDQGDINKPISYKGDRHLLTVAPTRSGKGTTQIIPNLLTYEGSTLVIDPKGENALITAQARQKMGQEVFIVDPWGIANVEGIKAARFNPLDWLQISDIDITENAMLLADSLVVPENHKDGFWVEEAKALLQGFILYVATDKSEQGKRHLGRVRDLLLLDGEAMPKHFQKMANSAHLVVASTGARCLQKEPKLLANVLATAQAQTHFLDSARIRESLSTSDFKFEDLKSKTMSIYLVLPADRLNTFGRWLRLLVQQAITVNARNIAEKPQKPILFISDEFAALGRLAMVEQAYGLMAGFGLQIWGIIQDFNQLERIYDKGWQSFVSNSGMINYFGSSDTMTAEYFSSMCGETTVWNLSSAISNAVAKNSNNGDTTTNTDTTAASQRKLAYPDELMRMKKGKQLVFIETMPPLLADKTPWFEDEKLKSKGVNLQDQ